MQFHTLTRAELELNLASLMAVSADASPWREGHFRADLPGKWQLSFYAFDGGVVGYAILSRRGDDWVHLHQFMVGAAARGTGVGKRMLDEVKERCVAVGARLTLKVAEGEVAARRFYTRQGLESGDTERGYVWMHWGGPQL